MFLKTATRPVDTIPYSHRLHLLGDPTMAVWTEAPKLLAVSVTPDNITSGKNQITVKISNLPAGQQALVCLMKGEEGYATLTVNDRKEHRFTFEPRTSGILDVTVTTHGFRPYETTIPVNASENPSVYISNLTFYDDKSNGSIGNGDGQIGAGETIALNIQLKNSGKMAFNRIYGTLATTNEYIELINSQADFGGISAGSTATSWTPFKFRIKNNAPQIRKNDVEPVEFMLKIENGFSDFYCSDTFKIDVFAPELVLGPQMVERLANGNMGLAVELQNAGKATATGLTAILSADSLDSKSNIKACPMDKSAYSSIPHFETRFNLVRFEFQPVDGYVDNSHLGLRLKVTNEYGKNWSLPFDPMAKCPKIKTSDITVKTSNERVELSWYKSTNASGYDIYRSDNGSWGAFLKLNNLPVPDPYFEDNNVSPKRTYYYKVAAIRDKGNQGLLSDPVKVVTSPDVLPGFPCSPRYRSDGGSILVADVDNDGYQEIALVAGLKQETDRGLLTVVNHEGRELLYESAPGTYTGIGILPENSVADPALGNMNGTGEQYIVATTWNDNSGQNVIHCYSACDKEASGTAKLSWQNVIGTSNYRGVVLGNMDNSTNGDLETVSKSHQGGMIKIINNKGQLVRAFGAGFGGNFGYSRPAVADLDNDGDLEIIACYDTCKVDGRYRGGGIYIWHHDGVPFARNPVWGNGISLCSPVICDLNKDGKKEIIVTENKTKVSHIYVIDLNGKLVDGWGTQTIPYCDAPHSGLDHMLSVGDINGDGIPEVVAFGTGMIKVWDNKGNELIKRTPPDKLFENEKWYTNILAPILADVDGDSKADIIFNIGDKIYAVNGMSGEDIKGFPVVANEGISNHVCVADIDYDGKNELIAADGNSKIYAWKTDGNSNAIEWGSERHDPRNTGEYAPICQNEVIKYNTIWNGVTPCGNVIVRSGKFTIPSGKNLPLDLHSMIVVRSGAILEINGGTLSNANVLAVPGSRIVLKNGGKIQLRDGCKMKIDKGATFSNQGGRIETGN